MTQQELLAIVLTATALLSAPPVRAQELPAATPPSSLAAPAWTAYKIPYVGEENDITQPNRTSEEITNLSQQTVAEVLSFGPADYNDRLNGFKKYFVPKGWQLYADYLKNSALLNKVTNDGYSLTTIVSTPPDIVSHGASGGAYHWIIKLPITISFTFPDRDGKARTSASEQYIVFMDMARVAEGGENGIAIQNWRVADPAAR